MIIDERRRRRRSGDLELTTLCGVLNSALNFTCCSQASTMFYENCKILKIIIYTHYIYFNPGKIELLDFMNSVCIYSAIAA